MNKYFITGVMRSGTTALQSMLGSHEILLQPFPKLFHRVFAEYSGSIDKPIRAYFGQGQKLAKFQEFLSFRIFTADWQKQVWQENKNYPGNWSKHQIEQVVPDFTDNTFLGMYDDWLHQIISKKSYKIGSKEIICEDFMPMMAFGGIDVLHMMRDPRDVYRSAFYGRGREYVGDLKPIDLIHLWRKSVLYYCLLEGTENYHPVLYEDLLRSPSEALAGLKGDFSGLTLPESQNSSFSSEKVALTQKEQEKIEWMCYPEMLLLGYQCDYIDKDRYRNEIIKLPGSKKNVEMKRRDLLISGSTSLIDQIKNFIFTEAFEKLSQKLA